MIDCLEKHCFVRIIAGRNIASASVHFLVGRYGSVSSTWWKSVRTEN